MNEQQQAMNVLALMKAATHHLEHDGIVAYQIAINWLTTKAAPKAVEPEAAAEPEKPAKPESA